MKQLYTATLLVILSSGLFISCGGDDDNEDSCANYTGPALTKGPNGSCYYIADDGSTVQFTYDICDCAK